MSIKVATPGVHKWRKQGWLGRVKGWLSRHHHFAHIVSLVFILISLMTIVAQLLYPWDRALPMMKVGGISVGLQDRADIVKALNEFAENDKLTLRTPSREWNVSWQTVGLSVDREASADIVMDYAWWERIIPFSSLARVVQSQSTPLIALVDNERIEAFATSLVDEDRLAAENETISIEAGEVKVDQSKNTYKFSVDEVERQIQTLPMLADSTVELFAEDTSYVLSEEDISRVASQAESALSMSLVFSVGDRTYEPSRADKGAWLVFSKDDDGKLILAVSNEKVKGYLKSIDSDTKTEPGISQVILLDGQEVSRVEGVSGRTVALDESIEKIKSLLLSGSDKEEVELAVHEVAPDVEYTRTYSKASSGLQSLIEDWKDSNYGDYGIIVRELTGEHRYAEWQPDKPMVTASTYKMFVVYTILTKVEQGELSLSQKTDIGWTVEACIIEVITNSTNPCAISMQNLIGWDVGDQMIHDAGFTSTFLNNKDGGDKYSTVRDETNFMLRLQSGTLMNAENTDFLLGLMKRQVWRGGIPSGVPSGTVVADKVGFYNSWVHDIAIVYAPKSTYILGIMSKGGSDPRFADLSSRVYNFFNQ